MKRIAFALLALCLGGALAFGQDATPAPQLKMSGYLGTGVMIAGNNGNTSTTAGSDTVVAPQGGSNANLASIYALDRNNGGAVDFRLNFNLDTATDGLQFSFWNGSANADFSKTNLQYAFAWASFVDSQIITKVGLQNDNTTGSDNMGYGTNDVPNTTGTNSNDKAGWAGTQSGGNTPAAVVLLKPAAVPGLAIDYYLPFPATTQLAGDAFGTSRIGAAYANDMFKVVANYEMDNTSTPKPSMNFGVKVTAVPNLVVRVEGSYVILPSSNVVNSVQTAPQGTSQFIQDIGYTIPLSDTMSVVPYVFVREFLSPNGVAPSAGTTTYSLTGLNTTTSATTGVSPWAGNWLASKNTGSILDLEIMPAITLKTPGVNYNLTATIANTSGSTINGVTTVYAIQPAVTWLLPASQTIQLGGAYGTMGNDALDGNFGQNIGGITGLTSYGSNAAYELYLNYEYAF